MAHTFDTKKEVTESVSNPVTDVYTCGAGATLLVYCITTDHADERTGTPTFGGIELTQAGTSEFSSTEGWSEVWYLLAPTTEEEKAVSVANPGTADVQVVVSSYISVTGVSAFDTSAQDSAISANPTNPITPSSAGNVIISSLFSGEPATGTVDHEELYVRDTGDESNGSQYYITTDTSEVDMGYTWGSDDWATVAASFREVVGSLSPSTSPSTSVSESPSVSPSASVSASPSLSPSISPSISPSPSPGDRIIPRVRITKH